MTLSCSNLTNFTPDPYGDLEYVPCETQAQAVALLLNWFGGSIGEHFTLQYDGEDDKTIIMDYIIGLKNMGGF